jgi:bacteriorhodopsin
MGFSTLVFAALAFRVPRSKRIFHYITAAITMVATIAYFTMGSNLGYAAVPVEFHRMNNPVVAGSVRSIFYVRYVDWVITTPVSSFLSRSF